MALVRGLVFLVLCATLVLFVMYAFTGKPQFRRYGVILLKWTVLLALVFFAALILQRL